MNIDSHHQDFKFGIDVLLSNSQLKNDLRNKRVSLVAHPASVTRGLTHSLDALIHNGFSMVSCFGPQHGMRGEKQDNMIESDDYLDPIHKIPVYSLYGKVRRPKSEWMTSFDVCLFDLQDVGTRIYTFLTTLLYMMEACQAHQKELWILDRPNPAGRQVEGLTLRQGWQSFVGAAEIPMRYGMTLGEIAFWFKDHFKFELELKLIKMENYGFKKPWPENTPWVNPSPNASNVFMARCFPGTVLFEGTTLSEGRGTTRPLELFGAPEINMTKVLKLMNEMAPQWMKGCLLRPCFFEPTFNKHQKELCSGIQIHVDGSFYKEEEFQPYRLVVLFLKSLRVIYPEYPIWRNFSYEYVDDKLAIDIINGSTLLREWVDNPNSQISDFEKMCQEDERNWLKERTKYLLY
ncbi:MAG: DUF1343 domain-containing protein [Deltaproteobacteria bacterium]|nr:DUF1343 domain-containing protein [Deltaproteobacteria bacterium]